MKRAPLSPEGVQAVEDWLNRKHRMKAISLHQPHASAMAEGFKKIETRSRRTHIRGDIAICSTRQLVANGKTWDHEFLKKVAKRLGGQSALGHAEYIDGLPRGVVLCVVEIYGCIKTEFFMKDADRAMSPLRPITADELFWGLYTPGRWGWLTRNLRPLRNPVPVSGGQFIFNLPPDVEREVRKQL